MSKSLAAIHSAGNQKDFPNIPGWGLADAIISTDINMNIILHLNCFHPHYIMPREKDSLSRIQDLHPLLTTS